MSRVYDLNRIRKVYPFSGYNVKPRLFTGGTTMAETIDYGTVSFSGQQTKSITFSKIFITIPKVVITQNNTGDIIPFSINSTSLTGFTIVLGSVYTGDFDWIAVGT